jgi:peptidyl-prolyl cis-trans isomerase C
MSHLQPLLTALCAGALLACNAAPPAPAVAPAPAKAEKGAAVSPSGPASAAAASAAAVPAGLPADTVVTVNGVPITEADIRMESKGDAHGALPDEGKRQVIVDSLVRRELLRQAALARHLETSPEYLARRVNLDAQIRAFERQELPAALFRGLLAESAVTEDEAKAWYAANEKRVGVEVHIKQLLLKSRAAAEKAKAELDAGRSFDEVAAAQFPNLPAAAKTPWDLGFMHWGKMPPQWLGVVFDTPDGKSTPIIEGAGNRFWILEVTEKRPAPAGAFDTVKAAVIERLRAERVGELQSKLEEELRKQAKIERMARPAATNGTDDLE